jgi:hypothetical protein
MEPTVRCSGTAYRQEGAMGGRKLIRQVGEITTENAKMKLFNGPLLYNYMQGNKLSKSLKRKKQYTVYEIAQSLGYYPGNLQMRDTKEMIGLIHIGKTGAVQPDEVYDWAMRRCAYMLVQCVLAQCYIFGMLVGQKSKGIYTGPNVGITKAGSQFSEGTTLKISDLDLWLKQKKDYSSFIDNKMPRILFAAAHISPGPVFVDSDLLSRQIRVIPFQGGPMGTSLDVDLSSKSKLLAIRMEGLESHTVPQPQTFNKMEYDYFEARVRDAFPAAFQKLTNYVSLSKFTSVDDRLAFFMKAIIYEMANTPSTLSSSKLDKYYIDYMDSFLSTLGDGTFHSDCVKAAKHIWQEQFSGADELLGKLGKLKV